MAAETSWLDSYFADEHLYESTRREPPPGQRTGWRIGLAPFPLTRAQRTELQLIGDDLWALMRAEAAVYQLALRDESFRYVADYLDAGKPDDVLRFSQMRRLRGQMPSFLRPDLLMTEDGFALTEVDSVPGGFGELAALQDAYSAIGGDVLGGPTGVLDGFMGAMRTVSGIESPRVVITVSDESADYRLEMEYLARKLRGKGHAVHAVSPRDLEFRESGIYFEGERVDVLYRFFELFDLRNVPKADLFLYAQRKGTVTLTPPIRPQLEEKLWMALLHDPWLRPVWQKELGPDRLERLLRIVPRTYILDPRPVPPTGIIPGLEVGGHPVRQLHEVARMSKRERARYLMKPSGFSDIAWGSRGVVIGEDTPQDEWEATLGTALSAFPNPVWLLQEFRGTAVLRSRYHDFKSEQDVEMPGRVRLCPYYFRSGDGVQLGGVLSTVCPADKKLIHGMVDAVMLPAGTEAGLIG